MADKRIIEINGEATAANMTDNDYGVIDGLNGTRKFKLSALATWIHNKWAAFVNALTAVTSFSSGDNVVMVNGTTAKKMSKDTLLELTAQNALAGNVAPVFIPSSEPNPTTTVAGQAYVYSGKLYVAKVSGYQGPWDASYFKPMPCGLKASEIVDFSTLTLTGISTIDNVGAMVMKKIFVENGTKVSVTIPASLWNYSNVTDNVSNVFTCGYYDEGGTTHNVAAYNRTNIEAHAGETIELPAGYTNYYVCMRGNSGVEAAFFIAKTAVMSEYVKIEGRKSVRTGSVSIEGTGDAPKVVQIPLYGSSQVYVDIPSTYPVTSIPSYNNACVIGYYTEVTEQTEGASVPRQTLSACTAGNIPNWAGTTQAVKTPSTAKSLFLFVRCDEGETITFGYTIEQSSGAADDEAEKNIRELQLAVKEGLLKADKYIDNYTLTLTGISTIDNVGAMVMKKIFVENGTKVSVTIPASLWNYSNVTDNVSNVFTCGYYDEGGTTHNVAAYNRTNIEAHAGETIELPVGYTNYYVCMRGNSGVEAAFGINEIGLISKFVKVEGRKSVRRGSFSVVGGGESAKVVQIPLYGSAKVYVDIPSTYPVTSIPSYYNACVIGYYTEVTDLSGGVDNPPRQTLLACTAANIPTWVGTTQATETPSSAKSLFLYVRCAEGETITFGYTIEQSSGVADDEAEKNIRELQLTEKEKFAHDAMICNYTDLISALTPGVSASDFPSGMKRMSSTYIKARPIVKNPGNLNTGSGFCIAPDGKVIAARYRGSEHVIGVSSLVDYRFRSFNKVVASAGVGSVHSNFMWFGDEKYAPDDKYPLLYVGGVINEDNDTTSTMSVIRIVGDLESEESCDMVLVQTISFASTFGLVSDIHKWGDKVVLWTGEKVWICDGFPSLSDGNVTFTAEDVDTEYTLSGLVLPGAPQSGCIVSNKLYEIHGGYDDCYLIIINLTDGSAVQTKMPSYQEWETLCYFDGLFFASTILYVRDEHGQAISSELVICSLEFSL